MDRMSTNSRGPVGCLLTSQRDKSLHPALVEEISRLTHLRTLEISGHAYRYYDPKLLASLPKLSDVRFMMPDTTVRDSLLHIAKELDARPGGGLRGLSLICRVSCLHPVYVV